MKSSEDTANTMKMALRLLFQRDTAWPVRKTVRPAEMEPHSLCSPVQKMYVINDYVMPCNVINIWQANQKKITNVPYKILLGPRIFITALSTKETSVPEQKA